MNEPTFNRKNAHMKKYITLATILTTLAMPAAAFDWEELRGPRGPIGQTGPQGQPGQPGQDASSSDYINAAAIGALELLDPIPGGWTGGVGVTGSEDNAAGAIGVGYGTSADTMLYGKIASDGRDALGSVGFSFRF